MKTTPKVYAEALTDLLEKSGASPKLAAGFVRTLRKNHQEKLLARILDLCEKILMERRGEIKVTIISPHELSDKQLDNLERLVRESTKKKSIILQKTDKYLRGGVKIAVGDYMIDGTIAGRLTAFARHLVKQ